MISGDQLAALERNIAWERKCWGELIDHLEVHREAAPGTPEYKKWEKLRDYHAEAGHSLEMAATDGTLAELVVEVRRLQAATTVEAFNPDCSLTEAGRRAIREQFGLEPK